MAACLGSSLSIVAGSGLCQVVAVCGFWVAAVDGMVDNGRWKAVGSGLSIVLDGDCQVAAVYGFWIAAVGGGGMVVVLGRVWRDYFLYPRQTQTGK